MTSRKELLNNLNEYLEIFEFSDRSINGLQVEGTATIKKVATAVSASEDVIHKAVANGVDALLVHHGLFWQGDSYVVDRAKKRKLQLLFNAGINLLAYHIPLDAHQEVGNNWKAARDMGWSSLQPFGEYKGKHIGVRGTLPDLPIADVQKQLERYYGHPAATALGGKEQIRHLALISGGAHWQIVDAVQEEMDAFITGSFDEPIWHIAQEESIHFLALGHSATEKVGPRALADYVAKWHNLETLFIDDRNPF